LVALENPLKGTKHIAEAYKPRNRVKFTTPPGRALYPRLDVPDTKFNKDGVYKVTLIWPAEVISPIREKVEKMATDKMAEMKAAAAAEKDPKEKKKLLVALKEAEMARSPFREVLDDEAEPTGEISCEFKMNAVRRWKDKKTGVENVVNQRPVVVDGKGKPTKAVPWSGSTMAVNFTAEADYWSGQKKVGVSVKLVAAQIIKLVQGTGVEVNPTEGFETYDDGFESYDEDGNPEAPAAEGAQADDGSTSPKDEDDGSGNF